MTAVLLDTHVFAWVLVAHERLTEAARRAIDSATVVRVSPMTIYEIARKVRLGKWPGMVPFASRLPELVVERGAHPAPVTPGICLAAATLDWPHRDPFDRIIAATALAEGAALVSADPAFDRLGGIRRVW